MLRNKAFFFATYEGYREKIQQNLNTTVPYQAVRDEILRALPFPETKIVLDILNLPTEPIVSSAGVVNTQVGMWRGLGVRKRDREPHRRQRRTSRCSTAPTSASPTRGCARSRWSPGRF